MAKLNRIYQTPKLTDEILERIERYIFLQKNLSLLLKLKRYSGKMTPTRKQTRIIIKDLPVNNI